MFRGMLGFSEINVPFKDCFAHCSLGNDWSPVWIDVWGQIFQRGTKNIEQIPRKMSTWVVCQENAAKNIFLTLCNL